MILQARKGRGEKVHLLVDGVYTATTTVDFWYSLGLKKNADLSAEELEQLLEQIAYRQMYDKALDLLTARDYSRKELENKLVQKMAEKARRQQDKFRQEERRKTAETSQNPDAGMAETGGRNSMHDNSVKENTLTEIAQSTINYEKLRNNAASVCNQLEENGLLNEERFARLYAEELVRTRHLGATGIRNKLREKFVNSQTIELVLQELELDEKESIAALLHGKFQNRNLQDEKDRRRTIAALVRMGYQPGDIYAVLPDITTEEF